MLNINPIDVQFSKSSSLESLDLSNIYCPKLTYVNFTFTFPSLLKYLNMFNFNAPIFTKEIIFHLPNYEQLDLSNFNTSITNMRRMLLDYKSLTSLNSS